MMTNLQELKELSFTKVSFGSGELRVESGELRVESGEWRVESGELRVGS